MTVEFVLQIVMRSLCGLEVTDVRTCRTNSGLGSPENSTRTTSLSPSIQPTKKCSDEEAKVYLSQSSGQIKQYISARQAYAQKRMLHIANRGV